MNSHEAYNVAYLFSTKYLFRNLIQVYFVILVLVLTGCKSFEADDWKTSIDGIGFSSSPIAVDLTEDGILDIVVGGGAAEFRSTPNGVLAINGLDGEILWSVHTRNQVVGTTIHRDINQDGVEDIFIGGRSAIFLAINGINEEVIWEFKLKEYGVDLLRDTSYLNFSSGQWIPDVDGDGLQDIIVAFGGYVRAKGSEKDRPVGSLKILSSGSGNLLAKLLMPDGNESYMTPIVHDFKSTEDPTIIFGGGGETIGGHLYSIGLNDLLDNNSQNVEILLTEREKGFVASPVLADINGDDILDIIANPVNGRMTAIDGCNKSVVWQTQIDKGYETYSMPGLGYFTGNDSVPDFYSSMGFGPWPNSEFCLNILVDGSNGKIEWLDTFGLFQYASPISYDFAQDGEHEVLFVVNDKRKVKVSQDSIDWYVNELRIFDQQKAKSSILGNISIGTNLGTTPLLTDLDHDGYLDVITCDMGDPYNFYSFQKGKIMRQELPIKYDSRNLWGGFMGSRNNATFNRKSSKDLSTTISNL